MNGLLKSVRCLMTVLPWPSTPFTTSWSVMAVPMIAAVAGIDGGGNAHLPGKSVASAPRVVLRLSTRASLSATSVPRATVPTTAPFLRTGATATRGRRLPGTATKPTLSCPEAARRSLRACAISCCASGGQHVAGGVGKDHEAGLAHGREILAEAFQERLVRAGGAVDDVWPYGPAARELAELAAKRLQTLGLQRWNAWILWSYSCEKPLSKANCPAMTMARLEMMTEDTTRTMILRVMPMRTRSSLAETVRGLFAAAAQV